MSYQVLARKWRPRTFKELVGQQHVVRPLINALREGRIHHAFLFAGTRGVGKTTIARIFAKALNCEQGISAEPCGICAACKAIDTGHFVDLIEVDAASRTKSKIRAICWKMCNMRLRADVTRFILSMKCTCFPVIVSMHC